MNPMESEKDPADTLKHNSILLSNQDIIPVIPSFEIQHASENLFSRSKKLTEPMENPLSFAKLNKKPKNSPSLKFLSEEKLISNNNVKTFFLLVKVFSLCRMFIKKLKENRLKQIKWKKQFPVEILHDKTNFSQRVMRKKGVFRVFHEKMKYYLRWKTIFLLAKSSQTNIFDVIFLLIIPLALLDAPLNLANLQTLTLMHVFEENLAVFLQTLCFFICTIHLLREIFKEKFVKMNYFEENSTENSKYSLFSWDFLARLSLAIYFFNEVNASLFPHIRFFIEIRILTTILLQFSTKLFHEKTKKVRYCLKFSIKTQEILDFCQLCLLVIYIIHNFSCFYLYLAEKQLEKGEIWYLIKANYAENSSNHNQDFSLYISAILLIIRGDGLLTSSKDSPLLEKITFLGIYAISCLLILVNLSNIYQIIKKINEKKEDHFNLLLSLAQGNVKYSTALMIQDILQRETQENKLKDNFLLEKRLHIMPLALKFEVFNERFGLTVKNLPFLQPFSLSFKKKFLMGLEEKRLYPNEVIIKSKGEPFFALVDRGIINVSIITSLNEEKIIKTCKKNDIYGEIFLFSDNLPLFSVISQNYSIIMIMRKESFLKIAKENSSDYEKYCYLRDKVALYSNTQRVLNKCEICEKKHKYCYSFKKLYWYFSFKQIFFLKKRQLPQYKGKVFNGRKKNKSKNSLNNKSNLLETLRKYKIIPHLPSTYTENKSNTITIENNSEELSDTSLGRFLQKKNLYFNLLKEKSNEIIETLIYNENDCVSPKKPGLLLENMSEESDVAESFTMNLLENAKFSNSFANGINLSPAFAFDKVCEFEHYFKHNNVSNVVIFSRKKQEKEPKKAKGKIIIKKIKKSKNKIEKK